MTTQSRPSPDSPATLPAKPFGWRVNLLVLFTFVLTLFAARLPDPLSLEMILAVALWAGLILFWLIRLILWIARPGPARRAAALFRWIYLPVFLMISLLFIRYDIPIRLAFDISRPALDRLVHQTVLSKNIERPGLVGIYFVSAAGFISPNDSPQVRVSLSETRPGFAFVYYLRDPSDPVELKNQIHLIGGWWIETSLQP